jgi:hypothetical protein
MIAALRYLLAVGGCRSRVYHVCGEDDGRWRIVFEGHSHALTVSHGVQ